MCVIRIFSLFSNTIYIYCEYYIVETFCNFLILYFISSTFFRFLFRLPYSTGHTVNVNTVIVACKRATFNRPPILVFIRER